MDEVFSPTFGDGKGKSRAQRDSPLAQAPTTERESSNRSRTLPWEIMLRRKPTVQREELILNFLHEIPSENLGNCLSKTHFRFCAPPLRHRMRLAIHNGSPGRSI